MAVTTAVAATAATVLSAMYLDAKLLLLHDVFSGALSNISAAALEFMQQRFRDDRLSICDDLEFQAKSPTNSQNAFLIFEGRTWTYKQFFEDVLRVANWLIDDLGIQRGEIVALNGTNSPEYLMMWFAIDAVGAAPAFINCNLTAGPLVHCVKLAKARYCITDEEVRTLVESSEKELSESGCQPVYYDARRVTEFKNTAELPKSRRRKLQITDLSGLLYTSGTTGMPKGIQMIRGRELNTARSIKMYLNLKPGNKMFTCLPLYHGAAHGLCVTPSVFAGSTVVLSRKFSHKTFWPEVRESKADIVQYVGELCRYLVNAPPDPLDRENNVEVAWGNGMRPDVWEVFRERFGIPEINELYAATDGVAGSFNRNRGDFGRNAVGKRGMLWRLMNSKLQKIIKVDSVTQEYLRDTNGFAIECKPGEPGELVNKMLAETAKMAFWGYFDNPEANEKRFVHGLFEKGDLWFRSGDLMRHDPDGCLYFVDRLGDTFRWKSENVSTNEVGDTMGGFDQIAETNVYGVAVPFADGRCGCAAIVPVSGITEQQLDFGRLAKHMTSTLPRYAVPIFVRVVKELQYTGTMKMQKGKLREEGIDLDKVSADSDVKDPIYWLPPGQSTYVPFTKRNWEELKAGKVKL